MKIRPAKISDAIDLAKIHVSGWQNAYIGIIPDDSLKKMSIIKRTLQFKKAIQDKTEETYIIEDNGKIFGFTTIGNCRDIDKKNNIGEIWGIYIDPKHWRKGYGKKLTEYAEKILKKRKYEEIVLWVLAKNNTARKFYKKLGFKIEGKTKQMKKYDNAKIVRYIKKI